MLLHRLKMVDGALCKRCQPKILRLFLETFLYQKSAKPLERLSTRCPTWSAIGIWLFANLLSSCPSIHNASIPDMVQERCIQFCSLRFTFRLLFKSFMNISMNRINRTFEVVSKELRKVLLGSKRSFQKTRLPEVLNALWLQSGSCVAERIIC